MLILETQRKFKAQKKDEIDPINFYPNNKKDSKFVANEKSIDIGSIKDLTLRDYRKYEEYAEEAYKYENCPSMPVDDQKKLLKAYKN